MRERPVPLHLLLFVLALAVSLVVGLGAVTLATQVLHFRCSYLGLDPETSSELWMCADGSEYLPLAAVTAMVVMAALVTLIRRSRGHPQ